MWKQALVTVHDGPPFDGPPFDEPLLDGAISTIGESAKLTDRGLIHPVRGKAFGFFPHTKWPASDRVHEAAVRSDCKERWCWSDLRRAHVGTRLAALCCDHAHKVVERGDLPVREVKRRAKDIADGAWSAVDQLKSRSPVRLRLSS